MPVLPPLEAADDVNSSDIKQEIARFESVHPSIYAMYDLIEAVADRCQAEIFRRQVASVEDAFVNSQEWTLGHTVPQIKLGLLGSVNSGKSALVHRYLTGTYLKDESPEGGRFKKEVMLDGMSNLLLIRDEGGAPDEQFSRWIDGAVFVFSLNSDESFRIVCDYFERLDLFRQTNDLPIILVGTQDSISELNPRVIDDTKARRLANSLNKCPYYETCSTYGLNVERVFQDACVKIVHSRPDLKYLLSNNVSQASKTQQFQVFQQQPQPHYSMQQSFPVQHLPSTSCRDRVVPQTLQLQSCVPEGDPNLQNCPMTHQLMHANTTSRNGGYPQRLTSIPHDNGTNSGNDNSSCGSVLTSQSNDFRRPDMHNNPGFEPDFGEESRGEVKESATPSGTPTQPRKTRPKSNLFRKTEDARDKDKKVDGIGSGRSIPIKQGYLYKRTCKPLNKESKTKKYVALTDDARLIYHPSIQDYVQNSHGKEIDLSRVTVKIPGITFRQTGAQTFSNGSTRNPSLEVNSDKLSGSTENANAMLDQGHPCNDGIRIPPQQSLKEVSKKRYRRVMKPSQKSGPADEYESEGYEFQLISMERQWHFEANNSDDRDDWVMHIDQAIIIRLQLLESSKRTDEGGMEGHSNSWGRHGKHIPPGGGSDPGGVNGEKTDNIRVDEAMAKSLRSVSGNDACADCGAHDPDWASLNLGEMVCIKCSGVHRRLGTHISRIRSLMLDDWTNEAATVMRAIGNTLANSVWEAAVPGNAASQRKPDSRSSKEDMEAWIRAKYERREFLPPLPYPEAPLQQQLIDAIARQDTRQVILCLARATPDTVNAPYSRQDARAAIHIAATLGNIVYLQLLLWYNGNPNVVDADGRNAFYYAHCSYHFDCANFLARNGCTGQAVPVPLPALFPMGTTVHQQNILPPQTHQQRTQQSQQQLQQQYHQQEVGVKASPGANLVTPKHPIPAFQQQQQQQHPLPPQSMAFRGPAGSMGSAISHPSPQGVMMPGFAPIYLQNVVPVASANAAMHGTISGNGIVPQAISATVAAGATLPRRRGPFHPQPPTPQVFLPQPSCGGGMSNRPLPMVGGFDPNTGRSLGPGLPARALNTTSSLNAPPPGTKLTEGKQEVGF